MTRISLYPASRASYEARAACMNAAYADYFLPLRIDAAQLSRMDLLYDVDTDASLVAEIHGKLAGMALLSRRDDRGWISAVGTIPTARRQGVARQMMEQLVTNAAGLGLSSLTLEVISENDAAHGLYRELGFQDVRELLSWTLPADADPLPIPQQLLSEASPESVFGCFDEWHKERPCWQREPRTLRRLLNHARAHTLDLDGQPAGYCLVSARSDSVGILDVGISPDFGPVRAGRPLLQALARLYPGRALGLMNVSADDPLNRALAALRFNVTVRQREMLLPL